MEPNILAGRPRRWLLGVSRGFRWMAFCALLLAPAAAAVAQRMPQSGDWSVWGGLGVTNPTETHSFTDEEIDATLGASGGIDYFVSRRFSVGALLGAWWVDDGFEERDVDESYLAGLATYNWEGGRFHPFVQGGIEGYFLDRRIYSDETKLGVLGGGGLDIFLTKTVAVDLALRYHLTRQRKARDTKFVEAHGGLKLYF